METLYLDHDKNTVVILDQNLLPQKIEYLPLTDIHQVWAAIRELKVRGAPAIGVVAAMGLYIEMKNTSSQDSFEEKFNAACKYLSTSRPTAVNLDWALAQMTEVYEANKTKPIPEIITALGDAADKIAADDTNICRRIGQHGATLLKEGMGILTHCNAGALAATKYGTALAPIYIAKEQGLNLRVYADETRPVLQGARLTAFELHQASIDTTLICDNMAATVMAKGLVDVVFVGCDRVAANGDTANKIGTYGVAVLAKNFGIPFYVCAPLSTIDMATATGDDIVIEERDPAEVTDLWYREPMAPKGVKVFNPAFDVTPANFISGYITENGIILPPFSL
ncbi:MAG: S-methyl-5-thioribose-1-phosphate isomerase [Defluviitaleaceae bacterium]|nr:S-methyl-5-thioribose-1-phosphate isomerase [Defluviitaleaceae bacterium]